MKYLGMVPIVLCFGYVGCFQPALDQDADDDVADSIAPGLDVPDNIQPDVPDIAPDVPDTVQPDVDLTTCDGRLQGSPCDDANPCTRDDQCTSRGCEGIPFACDDGLTCTEDRCDGLGGCTYPLSDGTCLIGGTCFAAGDVKADDACRICAGGQAWSPNDGGPCEDGDTTCTLDDTCDGLTCAGGPRPSDAATDWAMRPLVTTTPSTTQALAVGRATLDPVFLVTARGPAQMPAVGGDRLLLGDSVALIRRSSSGNTPLMVLDGFDRARVSAHAPNFTHNIFALAVDYEGAGDLTALDGSTQELTGPATSIIQFDTMSGTIAHRREWDYPVESMALRLTDGLIVAFEFTGTFTLQDRQDVAFENLNDPTRSLHDLALVSMSRSAATSWAVHLGTLDFFGRAHVCRTASNGAVVTAAFTDEVLIRHGSATSTVEASGSFATYLVAWVDADGRVTSATAPFEFTSDPEADGTILGGPFILSCSDTDALISINGALAASPTSMPYALVPAAASGSSAMLLRLSSAGALTQRIAFTASQPTAAFQSAADLLIAWVGGEGSSITDSAGATTTLSDEVNFAPSGLLKLSAQGELEWTHSLTRQSVAVVNGLIEIPQRGIVATGTSLFVDTTLIGADGEFSLPIGSDSSGFAVGLNTRGGLVCSQ